MALEGLWFIEGGEFDINVKDNWKYRLMILQPEFITQAIFQDALKPGEKEARLARRGQAAPGNL